MNKHSTSTIFITTSRCHTHALCILSSVFLTLTGSSIALAADEASLFNVVRDSLAIITMRTGSGSGFICQMNGKKYLITNEHVTRGGQPFSAILLDGRKLSFQSIEVADDRDLARLEITESTVKGLTVSAKTQNINDPVFVFGNSAGSGVATSLSGKILGIGPVEVETDAPFVAGNSGSPIVDQNGEVIAVATSATLHSDPSDWVKQGTRFTNVRRFGVKIDGAPWKLFNQQDYFIRTHALIDIKTFCVDLYNLRFTDSFIDTIAFRYNYNFVIEKKRYLYFPNFCKILSDAAVSFNKALDAEDEDRKSVV